MTCFICMNDALHGLPMQDKDELARRARDFVQGLILTAAQSNKGAFKDFQPSQRRGVCLVERCARAIEGPCGRCQSTQRLVQHSCVSGSCSSTVIRKSSLAQFRAM